MEYDIAFLAFILTMVLPVKVLPWLFIAMMAYKGYIQMKEKRSERDRQRRMAQLAERRNPPKPTTESQMIPISADHILRSRLGRR
ncbi:hypothetical protein [Ferrimonas pelagia]|uniref:Uncharacterized protein n=1 Tax=Ferrimonas pelagia TaxID=1177826 RepID=A0ABP9F2J8_9GAMM